MGISSLACEVNMSSQVKVDARMKMECHLCNMEFSKTDFKKHQLIHRAESFLCPHCDAAYKHLKHRDNHVQTKHELESEPVLEKRANVVKKLDFEEDKESNVSKHYKTPKKETKTPRKEAKTIKKEKRSLETDAKTIKKETNALKGDPKTPKKETKTPKKETKTPRKEAKTPMKASKTLKDFKYLKVDNCIGCKKTFSTAEELMLHVKKSPECEKKQKYSDILEWVKGGSRGEFADFNSKEMITTQENFQVNKKEEKRTSFENIFPKPSFGSNKTKKVAYVK